MTNKTNFERLLETRLADLQNSTVRVAEAVPVIAESHAARPGEAEVNTGLLARLSASAGRNIDLLRRARDSEAAVAGVRELHRRVWHAWTELDGNPGEGWICDHCTPTGMASKLTYHPCPTINVLDGSWA